MTIEIRRWWDDVLLHSSEKPTLIEALREAVQAKISLDGASLDSARLDGARLDGASLVGASLVGASLVGASLDSARLVGASLDSARLDTIRIDVEAICAAAPREVPGLLAALREGRFDGSHYEGECACLVGTVANLRGQRYGELEGLTPDSSRPAEVWALAVRRGDTPATNPVAALTEKWIADWLAAHQPTEAAPAVVDGPAPASPKKRTRRKS